MEGSQNNSAILQSQEAFFHCLIRALCASVSKSLARALGTGSNLLQNNLCAHSSGCHMASLPSTMANKIQSGCEGLNAKKRLDVNTMKYNLSLLLKKMLLLAQPSVLAIFHINLL